MAKKLNKTDRAKYDRLMKKFKLDPDGFDRNGSFLSQLDDFAHAMDKKYGEPMREIKGFNKGGMMKKKGYAKGGMKKKGYAKGGLKMVKNKEGKMVPFYAADGKGKMNKGGMMKKGYAKGGMKKKGYAMGGMMPKKMARGGFLAPAARPLKMRTKGGAKGGKK